MKPDPASAKSGRRRTGRPAGTDRREVRRQLLQAARELFARHGYDGVSMRRLAAEAGATPAMIHYYFGDKHGLYRALLEEVLGPYLVRLESLAGSDDQAVTVNDFMRIYVSIFRENPWLPPLVFREILGGSDAFRRDFSERVGSRVLPLLSGALAHDRDAGRVRRDLDPALAVISIMSLCVYPFLARPLIESNLGETIDDAFVERWLAHVSRLFYEGVSP